MKKITLTYIQGLASFLDELKIPFYNNGNNTITIEYSSEEELFKLGFKFGKFYETMGITTE